MKKFLSTALVAAFALASFATSAQAATVVTGDTSAGENQVGWLFNRDQTTQSPYELTSDGIYVLPIQNSSVNGNKDKFIVENFIHTPIADIESISFDFKLGEGVDPAKASHFYLSVYTNFGESDPMNYYDCRYNVVAETGSNSEFTTVTFDPHKTFELTSVKTQGVPPHACPAVPADMASISPASVVRAFAINVGDSTANDLNVSGYIDNVVVTTTSGEEVYDFEPVPLPTTGPVFIDVNGDKVHNEGDEAFFSTLEDAVNAAVDGDTIVLAEDVTTVNPVIITKPIVLDGNGKTLTLNSSVAGWSTTQSLGLQSEVTVKNLTVTTTDETLQDFLIEAFGANARAVLENVTLKNSRHGGLIVGDGAQVSLRGHISLIANSWGGIEVQNDADTHVTFESGMTLSYAPVSVGDSSSFTDAPVVWVDATVENPGDFVIDLANVIEAPAYMVKATRQSTEDAESADQVWWNKAAPSFTPDRDTVVIDETTSDINTVVPEEVADPKLDLTSIVTAPTPDTKSVTVPVNVTVTASDVQVTIPANTVITSSNGWDGTIALPTVTSASVTPTVGANETASVDLVIKVGSDSATLTFDKAVRLVFPGQAGKKVGYVSAGSSDFVAISAACSADDQATVDSELADGADCAIDAGSDLVVWTKHFTTFATYSVSTNAPAASASTARSSGRSSSRGGGGGGAVVAVAPAATVSAPVGQVLGASSYRFSSNLSLGASSDAVVELQERLRAEGYFTHPTSTGYFGQVTLAAVKAYQAAKGLPSTGFVGPLTIAKLNEALSASAAASTGESGISAKSFVELLISIGAIGPDKAAAARAAVAQ